MQEKIKTLNFSLNILFLSVFISCRWSWRWQWVYNMQSYTAVSVRCVRACISFAFVSEDKSGRSPLFMRAISCMRFCVYVPERAYLHPSFTAIQIIYSPLGLQDGFWPAALSRQQGNAAFLRLSPRNLLLFIMHGTPLDYCRCATLHRCSLQREAETGWRMGSGVQEDPC